MPRRDSEDLNSSIIGENIAGLVFDRKSPPTEEQLKKFRDWSSHPAFSTEDREILQKRLQENVRSKPYLTKFLELLSPSPKPSAARIKEGLFAAGVER